MASIGAKIAGLKNTALQLEVKLEKGWEWLRDNPQRPDHAQQEERWIGLLHMYEDTLDELRSLTGE